MDDDIKAIDEITVPTKMFDQLLACINAACMVPRAAPDPTAMRLPWAKFDEEYKKLTTMIPVAEMHESTMKKEAIELAASILKTGPHKGAAEFIERWGCGESRL